MLSLILRASGKYFLVLLVLLIFPVTAEAAVKYWVGTPGGSFATDSNWSTTSGSDCGTNQNTTAPTSSDVATFNSECSNNAVIGSNINVSGVDINTAFTGSITQNAGFTITVGSGNWDQAAGTFTGGDDLIDINGSLTISSGSFTSTSSGAKVTTNLTIGTGATFSHNNGSFLFDSTPTSNLSCGSKTLNLVGFKKTNNLFAAVVGSDCTISLGDNPNTVVKLTNNGTITTGTGTWSASSDSITNNGTITGSLAVMDVSGSFSVNTGATLTMSGKDLQVGASFTYYSTGTIPADIDLTLDGASGTLTCGGYSFNSVAISRTNGLFDAIIDPTCNLPSLGNNPSSAGRITNNGTITVGTGEWDINGSLYNNGTITGSLTTLDVEDHFAANTGSSLTMSGTNFTIGENFIYYSGVTFPANVDLTSDGASGRITCDGYSFNSVTISKLGSSFDAFIDETCVFPSFGNNPSSTGDINNYGTISTGTGEWDINGSLKNFGTINTSLSILDITEVFNANTGSILSMSGTDLRVGTTYFGYDSATLPANLDITFDSSSGTMTCKSYNFNSITVDRTISSFDFTLLSDCTTKDFTYEEGDWETVSDAITLTISGSYTQNANNNFGSSNLTVLFASSNTGTITQTTGTFESPMQVNKPSGRVWLPATFTTTTEACTIVEGTFDVNGSDFTCGSTFTVEDGGNLQLHGSETITSPTLNTGSTVTYNADSGTTNFLNLTHSNLVVGSTGSAIYHLPTDTLDVNNNLTISGGTLGITNAQTIALSGAWTLSSSALFSAGTGTVSLDGFSQSLTGTSSFFNLSKTVSSANTLTFGAGETFTITGTTTLQGAASNLLSLVSSSNGVVWNINPIGTRTMSYLSVKDSTNIDATVIDPANSTDAGNTINWFTPSSGGSASGGGGGKKRRKPYPPANTGPGASGGGGGRSHNETGATLPLEDPEPVDEEVEEVQPKETNEPPWSDFNASHPQATAALALYEQGVLLGNDDGTVKLDSTVSRVESLTLLLRFLGIEPLHSGSLRFSDTDPNSWYAPYILRALKEGIARGYGNGTFRPEGEITLGEALKIITVPLGLASFADEQGVSPWYLPYLEAAKEVGIYEKRSDNPNRQITRGDFVELLYQVRTW